MNTLRFSCILLLLQFLYPILSAQDISVPLRFDRYYSYRETNIALQELHKAYPELTKLDLVGKSEENREIWALTINNPKTGEVLEKPGVYADGNIHGNEIQATEVCLYLADFILKNYGKNEKITQLVDKNVFYIIPVVNVDGRYHFFNDGNTPHSNRGLRIPKDDDRDGLFDEDPPDDLDNDGNICSMRIKDPQGAYKTDPEDERLMIRVKPGEQGEWTVLGYEGIDNDNDGRMNEDAEGYVDPNRNWGYNWKPPFKQRGAGSFPFSGSGIKAIGEFIMARPNIIVVFAFHNTGGMFLRGPGSKDEEPYNKNDVKVYDYLGKNAEKIVPGYRYLVVYKDLYSTYGDFTTFTYNIAGAYSFVSELFIPDAEMFRKTSIHGQYDKPNRTKKNRERLKFNDYLAFGEIYKPWTKYTHPVYGKIEIGGYVKTSQRIPQEFMLPELVHRNIAVVLFAAEQTPEISMEIAEPEKMEQNLYKVRVTLHNSGNIPTMTFNSIEKKLHTKDILKVEANVIAGGRLLNKYTGKINYKKYKPNIQFLSIPGNTSVDYQFIISGKGKVEFEYTSLKAGKTAKSVVLQ